MNIKTKLLISLLITLTQFTVNNPTVKADYIPPAEQERASDYSKSTGVRTGLTIEKDLFPLTILAPVIYVGHTLSKTPTFVWAYGNSQNNYQMEFRLFEFDDQNNLLKRGEVTIINTKGGIITLPFPSEQLPLEQYKKYLWQISIRNSQTEKLILQRAELRVVETPPNLAKNIENMNETQQGELYAEYGFWYDALIKSLNDDNGELGDSATPLICALIKSEKNYSPENISPSDQKIVAQRVANLRIFCNY